MLGKSLDIRSRKEEKEKMKPKMVAAVDVGSSKVCSLLANVDNDGSVQVVGIGIVPARGVQKGMVADIDQASAAIRDCVRRAEQTSGESISSVYLGISGSNMSSQPGKAMVSVSGKNARPVSTGVVRRAITCVRDIDIGDERKLLHVIPTSYRLDTQGGVKDPVGLVGSRLDVDAHIVTIPEVAATNMIRCAHKAGLKIEGLVLQCLASAQAVLHPDEIDAGVVLADIGAGVTGLCAYKEGNVEITAVLPVGGNHISRDLSIGLGLPFDVTEQIKKEHCNLAAKEDADSDDEPTVEVNFDGVGKIYKRDINDIVKARVEEIMKLIVTQLVQLHPGDYRAYLANFPAGLVLTGGTAKLAGIRSVAQEVTGLPTRVGVPGGMSGLADQLYDAAYASSVGVLICGGKWHIEQNWVRPRAWDKVAGGIGAVRQHVPWRRS